MPTEAPETPESTDTSSPSPQPETDAANEVEKWKSLARQNEAKAKANAEAAKRLVELEESSKSDAQRTADRLAKLEAETASARAEALRLRVAATHGVSAEDAELFLTATDEETLTRQAKRLAERVTEQRKRGGVAPNEGKNPTITSVDADERAFVRDLLASS